MGDDTSQVVRVSSQADDSRIGDGRLDLFPILRFRAIHETHESEMEYRRKARQRSSPDGCAKDTALRTGVLVVVREFFGSQRSRELGLKIAVLLQVNLKFKEWV